MSLQPRGKVRTKEINVGEVGLEAINQGRVEVEKVGQQRRWRRGSWRRERKSTACRDWKPAGSGPQGRVTPRFTLVPGCTVSLATSGRVLGGGNLSGQCTGHMSLLGAL